MAVCDYRVKVVDVSHVSPASNNKKEELCIPLSRWDIPALNEPPTQLLFFYQFSDDLLVDSIDSVVSALKTSLSLTLSHFLPLAGNLSWPPHIIKPFIHYTPDDTDSVLFTIAQIDDDDDDDDDNISCLFDTLSANDAVPVINWLPLLPRLDSSDTRASVIAFQVTSFGNKGFCLGISSHHAVLDGKSFTMFMKAWSYICTKQQKEQCIDHSTDLLPPELTPLFNPDGIRFPVLRDKEFEQFTNPPASHSLKILLDDKALYSKKWYQTTFVLTKPDIDNLKRKILSCWQKQRDHQGNKEKSVVNIHLSTFVVTCAYVLVCFIKALSSSDDKGKSSIKGWYFTFGCDVRCRFMYPVPQNYFGNCVESGGPVKIEENDLNNGEDGIATLAEKISNEIKELDDIERYERTLEWWFSKMLPLYDPDNRTLCVGDSPKFEYYGIDLGYGKPKRVERLLRDDKGFSLLQNKDQNGGIQVSLLLTQNQMEIFRSLFSKGLN